MRERESKIVDDRSRVLDIYEREGLPCECGRTGREGKKEKVDLMTTHFLIYTV